MTFATYKETRPWAKAIREAVRTKKMPPWFADPAYGHFSNDRSMSPSEIDTLAAWADSDAPAGDPKDAPAAAEMADWLGNRKTGCRPDHAHSLRSAGQRPRLTISTL